MLQLKITDLSPRGCLAFDLKDILRALGPQALTWIWTVSDVEAIGELWATGDGVPDLETIKHSGIPVSGSRLAEVAERINQVIWGEFCAFRSEKDEHPWVRIVAFDSSWYEVWSEDRETLIKIGSAFKSTTLSEA